MRIEELLIESHNLEEGPIWDKTKAVAGQVGSAAAQGVGAAASGVGAVAGGIRGAWDKAKQGYKKGFNAVVGTPRPGQTDAGQDPSVQGQQSANQAASGQDPNQLRQQGQALIKQADQLEKQQKQTPQQTTPAQTTQQTAPAPAGQDEQQPPAEDPNAQQAGATPQPADANAQQQASEPQSNQAAPAAQTAAPEAPAEQPAAPAGTPPAGGKLSQQQIDQKKAEMKSRRAGGTNMAAAGGTGYKDSRTGVGVQKPDGIGPDGNYKYRTVREEWQFESRFLGMRI